MDVEEEESKTASCASEVPENDDEVLAEPDVVETGEDQPDTESDDDDVLYQINDIGPYFSKNGAVQWSRFPLDTGKTRSVNKMTGEGGVTPHARSRVMDMPDCIDLFLTSAIKELIVLHTNEEGNRRYGKTEWVPFDVVELDAFLGMLLLQGVHMDGTVPVSELWSEGEGKKIYKACMSRKRFAQITCSLRFDDKSTREKRVELDKMTHVREFFEMWSLSLRTNYLPYESACVDEQLFPFKGRCGFKQYIPTKPRSKYGLKLFLLCCCRTSYCCNIQLYTGKPVGGKPEKNQGKRVVLDLVDYLGDDSGRNVTTDNFFTSLALGEALLKKNISLIGTIRKSRPEIPSAFLPSKYSEVHSSLFGHTSDFTLVSYVPKKGKAVTLLSSMHLDA
ncbi:hypothetical protein RvY_19539 [Ramazzottius varieornatus]|uniref:PiggyBac transposable element-derived protein domain-containing protein n=1 Tax=Ramazzottius varieornatus TaxID=947166 RepID=A0A1D1W9J9_RAMVA|nr:hypothetical protein RvY_19539 [Ramazzottius varieornatus]